ncbi:MAG: two-component regulator propeller domain-containing protein [Planctomycetota bacterium]
MFLLAALLPLCNLAAQDPTPSVPEVTSDQVNGEVVHLKSERAYQETSWHLLDGLPQNNVTALAQDPDGRLWLGTLGGLARFDGVDFEVFPPEMTPGLDSNRILSLFVRKDGSLLIGSQTHGIIQYKDGAFSNLKVDWGRPTLPLILDFAESSTNEIYVAHNHGVSLIRGTQQDLIPGGPGQASSICIDQQDRLWIASAEGLFVATSKGTEIVSDKNYQTVFCARDGNIYATSEETLEIRKGQSLKVIPLRPTHNVWAIKEDSRGNIWLGSMDLAYWDGKVLRAPFLRGRTHPRSGIMRALCLDRDGNLWKGGVGLHRISNNPLTLQWDSELPPFAILPGPTPDSHWVAKRENTLTILRNGITTDIPGIEVESMARSKDGSLWVADLKGALQHLGPLGEVISKTEDHFLGKDSFYTLFEDSKGSLWASSGDRIQRYFSDQSWTASPKKGLPGGNVTLVFEASDGAIWIGTELGISRFQNDQLTQNWTSGHELPNAPVRCCIENDDGSVWVGTYGGGMVHLIPGTDQVFTMGVRQGIPENIVSSILDDGHGNFALMGNRGIHIISKQDCKALLQNEIVHLHGITLRAGNQKTVLEGNGIRMNSSTRDAEGNLWFTTVSGVARLKPGAVESAFPHAEVRIDSVKLDGVESPPNLVAWKNAIKRNLEIHFQVASLSAPDLAHFRYRLLGYEQEWVRAGTRRIAFYNRLPPGNFTFQVQTRIQGQEWDAPISELPVTLPRFWFEAWWFRSGLIAVGLLALYGIYRLSVRQILHRSELLEAKVASRTKELEQIRNHLEADVQERTQELELALDNLQKDVEERKNLEASLRRSEKMEAIGRLSGGIAHDFNNILTAILGETDLALLRSGKDLSIADLDIALGNIKSAAEKAAKLTAQLLAYSGKQEVQPEALSLCQSILKLESMLRRLIREDISLLLELDHPDFLVSMDPGQAEQVVMNLVVNAADSCGRNGTITVQCRACSYFPPPFLACKEAQTVRPPFAWLTISDDGEGMSEETMTHIFEPFFSTKAPSEGSGLGLASVQGIVRQADGLIHVDSQLGEGTTFHILLPLAAPTHGEPSVAVQTQSPLESKNCTILFCDDDLAVREVTHHMLQRLGHTVIVADSPMHALELMQQHKSSIHILLTDAIMPGMNGKQLAEKIQEMKPEIGILHYSGYSFETLNQIGEAGTTGSFLAKPFTLKDLGLALQGCLAVER